MILTEPRGLRVVAAGRVHVFAWACVPTCAVDYHPLTWRVVFYGIRSRKALWKHVKDVVSVTTLVIHLSELMCYAKVKLLHSVVFVAE